MMTDDDSLSEDYNTKSASARKNTKKDNNCYDINIVAFAAGIIYRFEMVALEKL
jgi:hypothetical protein